MDKISCDYLLITALDDEAQALHEAFKLVGASGPERVRYAGSPTTHKWSLQHNLGTLEILTASLPEMGHDAAREWTRGLLQYVLPTYLGFIGIAGAASNDPDFGTVLIADRIWYYEPAKLIEDSEQFRGPIHLSGRLCLDRLKTTDLTVLDRLFPQSAPWTPPIVGTIASGEKVVASQIRRDELRKAGRNVIGFEMEGHSFADEVEKTLGRERWFMVRAVQDKADATKTDNYRKIACDRAAQFVVGFILDSDLCIPEAGQGVEQPNEATDQFPTETDRSFVFLIASKLAEHSPDEFTRLSFGRPSVFHDERWDALEAEAWWRLGELDNCFAAACRVLTDLRAEDPLTEYQGAALRLKAWVQWRRGEITDALALLKAELHRVLSRVERGRWTDLLATITRMQSGEDAFDAAVGWYQQALSLKEASGDDLGYAITLKQIAFAYTEILDLRGAGRYFRRLIQHTTTHLYPESNMSYCYGLLGLAWIDLIKGGHSDLDLARRRLALAGQRIASLANGPVVTDIKLGARALRLLLDVRKDGRHNVPSRFEKSQWPAIIAFQARVLMGEEPAELVVELTALPLKQEFAPQATLALISAVKAYRAEPPRTALALQRNYTGLFWPLGMWLSQITDSPLSGMQLLEGIANLYVAITRGIEQRQGPPSTIGMNIQALSEWAASAEPSPLRDEVSIVASLLSVGSKARNEIAHSAPGQPLDVVNAQLTAALGSILDEISLLKQARWLVTPDATLDIAGRPVQMEPYIVRDETSTKLGVLMSGGTYLLEA